MPRASIIIPFTSILTFLLALQCTADPWYRNDSVQIKAPARVIVGDKEIEIKNDTTIYLADSLEFIVLSKKKFFVKKGKKSRRNVGMQYIKTWLFAGKPDTNNIEFNRKEYLSQFEGKIIRNIKINNVDVFGATLTSSTPENQRTWLERSGNRLHQTTRPKLIARTLGLKSGEIVDPYELSEREVIIRNLPFIADAMISPTEIPQTDSIDLNVYVQDIWSLGLHWEPQSIGKGYVETYEENMWGLGHEIKLRTRYNSKKSPATGFEASYTINNIGTEVIKTTIGYSNYFGTKNVLFDMYKDYYYQSNTAFGLTFQDNISEYHYAYINEDQRIGTLTHDMWIGQGFPLFTKNTFDPKKPQIYAAFRTATFKFDGNRLTTEYTNNYFANRNLYLASIAIAKQWYNQTKLLLGYGRTEDIPYGYKFEFVGGAEQNEFRSRPYYALKTAGGDFFRYGYLSGYGECGGFVNNRKIEQGTVKAGLFFYSNLLRIGLYRFRQFVNLDVTTGFNRFYGYNEELYLSDEYGIRGFESDSVRASKRVQLRLETVAYSPYKIGDFKMAFFNYFDFAWLNTHSNNITNGPIYTGLGLGVRIRNDKLAFKTFTIRFAIYPNIPRGGDYRFFDISGTDRLQIPGYKPSKPSMVDFR